MVVRTIRRPSYCGNCYVVPSASDLRNLAGASIEIFGWRYGWRGMGNCRFAFAGYPAQSPCRSSCFFGLLYARRSCRGLVGDLRYIVTCMRSSNRLERYRGPDAAKLTLTRVRLGSMTDRLDHRE